MYFHFKKMYFHFFLYFYFSDSAGFKITPAAASHVRNTLLKKTQARLKAPAESSIHGQFKGHTMSVTAIQVFKDHVYTGSLDTTARKFDLKVRHL